MKFKDFEEFETVEEAFEGLEVEGTQEARVSASSHFEFVEDSRGVLSCGGAYIPRVPEFSPFRKQYRSLHLPNARQQVILMKNLKPMSITNLEGPILDFGAEVDRFGDEETEEPLKKIFRDDWN